MISINQAERQKAFLKFLLFFVITVAMVVTAVLFSVQVPLKENELMREQKSVVDNEKDFLASFENNIQQTVNSLNSLDTLKNPKPVDVAIETKVENLYKQVQDRDTLSVRSLCNIILDNLSNLHQAKIDQRVKDNNEAEIQKLNKQITDWKTAWTNCVNGRVSKAPSED